jgi:hypothetical protein
MTSKRCVGLQAKFQINALAVALGDQPDTMGAAD